MSDEAAQQGDEADEAGASDGASQLIPGVGPTFSRVRPGVNDERDGQSTTQSPLSQDSFADKAIRFGCGSLLATLVFTVLVLSGLGEPLSVPAVVTGGIVLIVVSGVLSVALGERFLEPLLKLIRWL